MTHELIPVVLSPGEFYLKIDLERIYDLIQSVKKNTGKHPVKILIPIPKDLKIYGYPVTFADVDCYSVEFK